MNRNKVEDVLFSMGISANLKGFGYIADAMEVFDKTGFQISVTKFLYPQIATKNNTVPSRVERAIRHVLEIARSARGNHENFDKYIGFANTTNAAALISLYKHIKRDDVEPEKEEGKTEPKSKEISPELESALRRIVREELRRILLERQ